MKWYWGLAWLAGGAALGAGIGALVNKPCTGSNSLDDLFCGPKDGAIGGAAIGVFLAGVAGVGATVSPDTRAAGLTAALPVAALLAVGTAAHAMHGQLGA